MCVCIYTREHCVFLVKKRLTAMVTCLIKLFETPRYLPTLVAPGFYLNISADCVCFRAWQLVCNDSEFILSVDSSTSFRRLSFGLQTSDDKQVPFECFSQVAACLLSDGDLAKT